MPIEFRCESCSKLLRTPDESAGKKAKCPQCGTVVDVPDGSSTAADESASSAFPPPAATPPSSPAESPSPFAGLGDAPAASQNPYASPGLSTSVPEAKPSMTGELSHQKISFDDVVKTAWSITMDYMGPMAIFGVILFGIQIALGIFGQVINFAGQMSQEVVVMGAVQFLNMVVNFIVQTWVGIVTVLFCTKMARDRRTDLNVFAQGASYFARALGVTIVLGGISFLVVLVFAGTPALITWISTRDEDMTALAAIGGALLCVIPLVMLMLNFFLSMFFVVDRGEGVFAAMGQSRHYMRGNKLTAFLTMMVVQFLGGLFVLVTCCAGRIIFDPFSGLVLALIYLTATGQQFERPSR